MENKRDFLQYTVKVWDSNKENEPNGIFVSGDFTDYVGSDSKDALYGFFFHEGDTMLSIELDTKDEKTISEAVSICKRISSEFFKLSELISGLYE